MNVYIKLGELWYKWAKMMCNNPNVDLVNMNVCIKFGEILLICSQDIEQKQNYDRRTDGQPKSNLDALSFNQS